MRCTPLPPADRASLAEVFRTAPDHPTRQRAVILLLLNAGAAWLDERRFFRVTRKMYEPPQKAQDFR